MQASIRRSLAISFFETYSVMGLSLVGSIILARLLTPEEIGIFSLGAVTVAIAHLIRDFGVGGYLIQVADLNESRLRAAIALQIAISVSLAVLLVLLSHPIARFYVRPELRLVITLLAFNFLLVPFGSILMTWFRREFQYRASFITNVAGTLTGVSTTIALAALDFGYMSLVWGSLVNTAVTVAVANCMRPSWFPVLPSYKGMRELINFGGYASAAGVVKEAGNAAPDLVIGKVVGVSDVAIYGKAVSIVSIFSTLILRAVWPISTPTFARRRHAGADVTHTYYKAMSYLTALGWPFFAFIGVMAFPLVRLLFGEQWDAAVSLVRILAFQGAMAVCYGLTSSLLAAHGRMKHQFAINLLSAALGLALLIGTVASGLEVVAFAAGATALFTVVYSTWMLKRILAFRTVTLIRCLLPSLAAAALVALSVGAVLFFSGQGLRAENWLLAPGALAAILAWSLVMRVGKHPLMEEVVAFAKHVTRVRIPW
jgi:O-antigen/teichoic acid export membrane protein